jgi:hypothetical protein
MNEDVQIIRDLVADHDPAATPVAAEAHADADGRAALERILAAPQGTDPTSALVPWVR